MMSKNNSIGLIIILFFIVFTLARLDLLPVHIPGVTSGEQEQFELDRVRNMFTGSDESMYKTLTALDTIEKKVTKDNYRGQVLYIKGLLYYIRTDTESALAAFGKARPLLTENDYYSAVNNGFYFYLKKDLSSAERYFLESVNLSKYVDIDTYLDSCLGLVSVYMDYALQEKPGAAEKAVYFAQELMNKSPYSQPNSNLLVLAYFLNNQYTDIAKHYAESTYVPDSNLEMTAVAAITYFKLNDFVQAQKYIDTVEKEGYIFDKSKAAFFIRE